MTTQMELTRLPDWAERLDVFLQEYSKGKPFEWGKNDCSTLAAGAVEAITGAELRSKFDLNYTNALAAARVAERLGGSYEKAFSSIFDGLGFQRLHPDFCKDGDLAVVTLNGMQSAALYCGGKWKGMGKNGLVTVKNKPAVAWRVGEKIDEGFLKANFTEEQQEIILAMPFLVPIIGGVAGMVAGYAAAQLAGYALTTLVGQIIFAVVSTVVTAAISFIGMALFPAETPKPKDGQNRGDTSRSFIQPLTSHKIIYGTVRTGGPIAYYLCRPPVESDFVDTSVYSTEDSKFKDMLHLIIILAGHEVYSIDEIFLDDIGTQTFDANGFATAPSLISKSRSKVKVDKKKGGSDNATPITELVTKSNEAVTASIVFAVTKGHPIDPGAWVEIEGSKMTFVTGSITDPDHQCAHSYDLSDAIHNFHAALAASQDANIKKCTYGYFEDIGSARFKIRIRVTYDGDDKITIKSSTSPKSWAKVPKNMRKRKWTNEHLLQGLAYIHVRLEYDEDIFPSGLPNVSAIVKGRKVYDPRGRTTHPEWGSTTALIFSENPALCILDYLRADFGLKAENSEIDWDSFIYAIGICNETVDTITSIEKRYTCNGVVDLASTPQDILEGLLTSCAGRLLFTGGKWYLYVGYWTPNALPTLYESYLRDSVEVSLNRSRMELVNTVCGAFTDPNNQYQPTDYPVVDVGSTGVNYMETEDDNIEYRMTLDLPFTNSYTMAQRIARIALELNRKQITVSFPANLEGLRFRAGDYVYLTLARFWNTSKIFLIANWKLTEDLGIDLKLQEENSSVYVHNKTYLKEMEFM